MQIRDRGSLMGDRRRVTSAIGVGLVLLVAFALAAAGGIAEALPVYDSQSSESVGLETDLSAALTLAPSNPVDPFDAYVSPDEMWPLEDSTGSTSVGPGDPLFGDQLGGDTPWNVLGDYVPTLSLSGPLSADEGDGMTFVVRLTAPYSFPCCINGYVYAGQDSDTATPGVDYFDGYRKSFSFEYAGEESFYIPTYEDDVVEPDEYFTVVLSSSPTSSYTFPPIWTKGWILNDDCHSDVTSYVSFGDATVIEGDEGTTTADFAVTLDPVNTCPVKIKMITSGVGSSSVATATPGEDYVHRTSDLTFAPGQASKTFSVTINGDTTVEFDEYFYVKYVTDSLVGAEPPEYAGIGTIVNDDGDCESDVTSYLSFGDSTVIEGDDGTTTTDFAVTLDPVNTCPVKIKVSTSGVGSAPTATATPGEDYEVVSRYLTFDPGQASKTFSVTINGDTTVELDETFYIAHVAGSLIGAEPPGKKGVGTIINDDDSDCESDVTSYLSVGDSTVTEGDDGTTIADFAVTLDPANACPVIVRYETCGVGCDTSATATPGEDYDHRTSDLTFDPGTTSKTFSVTINADTTVELDETFFVRYVIDSATGIEPPEKDGVGTITNDDSSAVDTFVDDDDSIHEADIEWLVAEGITKGCATNPARYCPEAVVHRSEMATFMIRAMGEVGNVPAYQGYFADVAEGQWYTPFVERAYELGLTNGCDAAPLRYCPEGTVLRSEMAAFLVRQIEGDTNLPTYQGYFTDVPSGLWYTAYTERLYELGITLGCATNPARYCPTDPVLREQMATFLHRTFG